MDLFAEKLTYIDGHVDAVNGKGMKNFSRSKEYDRGYMDGVAWLGKKEEFEKFKLDEIMSKTENNKWDIK